MSILFYISLKFIKLSVIDKEENSLQNKTNDYIVDSPSRSSGRAVEINSYKKLAYNSTLPCEFDGHYLATFSDFTQQQFEEDYKNLCGVLSSYEKNLFTKQSIIKCNLEENEYSNNDMKKLENPKHWVLNENKIDSPSYNQLNHIYEVKNKKSNLNPDKNMSQTVLTSKRFLGDKSINIVKKIKLSNNKQSLEQSYKDIFHLHKFPIKYKMLKPKIDVLNSWIFIFDIVYQIENSTLFRFFSVQNILIEDKLIISNKFFKSMEVEKFIEKIKKPAVDIIFDNDFQNFESNFENVMAPTFNNTAQNIHCAYTNEFLIQKLFSEFNLFMKNYFETLKNKKLNVWFDSNENTTSQEFYNQGKYCEDFYKFVLNKIIESYQIQKIFVIFPELKIFIDFIFKTKIKIRGLKMLFLLLEAIIFKFEFLKASILNELSSQTYDFIGTRIMHYFLFNIKTLTCIFAENIICNDTSLYPIQLLLVSTFFSFIRFNHQKNINLYILTDLHLMLYPTPSKFLKNVKIEKMVITSGSETFFNVYFTLKPFDNIYLTSYFLKSNDSYLELLYNELEKFYFQNERKKLQKLLPPKGEKTEQNLKNYGTFCIETLVLINYRLRNMF